MFSDETFCKYKYREQHIVQLNLIEGQPSVMSEILNVIMCSGIRTFSEDMDSLSFDVGFTVN